MEFRKLRANTNVDMGVLCDHWHQRKEEKSISPCFQFSVTCSESSISSTGSISSSSLCDDALSSSSSSSSLSWSSSLVSQNELGEQQLLPIKKGLSKFYEGKSRTFSSLSEVKCIEDLAKRESNYRKRDSGISLSPKATITKKLGRSSFANLVSKAKADDLH